MLNNDYARISDGLRRTRLAVRDYVVEKLREKFAGSAAEPDQWWTKGVKPYFDLDHLETLGKKFGKQRRGGVLTQASDDPANLLEFSELRELIQTHQSWILSKRAGVSASELAGALEVLRQARNETAHAHSEFSSDQVTKVLDIAATLLEKLGSSEAAIVRSLRDNQTDTPKGLPVWWQVATPHEDIRQGNFDENAFAAKLDDVWDKSAAPEYQDPIQFFNKTYFTNNLRDLIADTLKRLAGKGGQAVTQLRTPFGGGKTHALISLYHLVWNAKKLQNQPDIAAIVESAGLTQVLEANLAVIVGTALNPLGRKVDGLKIQTLWGELGYQIGGKAGYEHFAEHDQRRIAPGKDLLKEFFAKYGSSLILLDEILVYQVKVADIKASDSDLQAQTFAFLQELSEVVGGSPGLALVTTFPQSHTEYYKRVDASEVFATLEKIFGRLETVRSPVQGDDIYEVVRRRLFDSVGDQQQIERVVRAYWEEYQNYRDDLPLEIKNPAYFHRMIKAYPFHPALMDVLQERWGSLPKFQRTRGVLRLLGRVIALAYGSPTAAPLIGPASLSMTDDRIRASVADIVGEEFDAAIASDLAEPGERALSIDREKGGTYLRKRLAEGAANTVFLYSHAGGGIRGATTKDVALALIDPETTPALVTDVLERLRQRLYYIHSEGDRVSFLVQPNLNRVLEDRKTVVRSEHIEDILWDTAKGLASSRGNIKVIAWPEEHRDVPDNRDLKIVMLGPNHMDGTEECERFINATIDATAGARRQFPNTVVFLIPQHPSFLKAKEYARELQAIRDIQSDNSLMKVLDDGQRDELVSRKNRASQAIPNALRAAYAYLSKVHAEPTQPNQRLRWYREVRADIQAESDVVKAIVRVLKEHELYAEGIDPALLVSGYWGLWPEEQQDLPLTALRDYFAQLPHLPILANDEVLQTAIARGVGDNLFGLAVKQGGQINARASKREGAKLFAVDVEISTIRYLIRPGVLQPDPKVESQTQTVSITNTDLGPVIITPPVNPTTNGSKYNRVRLDIPALPETAFAHLVEVLYTLNDAGANHIDLTITATSTSNLDKQNLELNLPEVLTQYGIEAKPTWEN